MGLSHLTKPSHNLVHTVIFHSNPTIILQISFLFSFLLFLFLDSIKKLKSKEFCTSGRCLKIWLELADSESFSLR